MNKLISILLTAGLCLCASVSYAETEKTTKPAVKKAVKKPAKKDADSAAKQESEISGATAVEYSCAGGRKLTIYRKPGDEQNATLRWNKQLHPMKRVETESGAERFENTAQGLLWIGIPAKAMLFDSKKGQQLANDCLKPGQ